MTSDLSVIREQGLNALTRELGSSGMAIFIANLITGAETIQRKRMNY